MLGSVVTVANVGDSRVVLGYQQELFPLEGMEPVKVATILVPPESTILIPTTDTAATTPEDCGSIDCSHSQTPVAPELDFSLMKDHEEEVKCKNVCTYSAEPRQYHKIRNIQLSSDHKPDVPAEKTRIMLAG